MTYRITIYDPRRTMDEDDGYYSKRIEATDQADAERRALIDESAWAYIVDVGVL